MKLNLPIFPLLEQAKRILIAGIGGGYDLFCGLPLYYELRQQGKIVHLANLNSVSFTLDQAGLEVFLNGQLVGVHPRKTAPLPYCPESLLANWLADTTRPTSPIWIINLGGLVPVSQTYQLLCQQLQIDALILVDGGVDSLMRGDEESPGTLLEDVLSLGAAAATQVPIQLLVTCGFGTELADGLSHYRALENIATLTHQGGFLGASPLTPQMKAFEFYNQAVQATRQQPQQSHSRINLQITNAVVGQFGDVLHPTSFLSPLMTWLWCFDLAKVIEANLLLPALAGTHTFDEVLSAYLKTKVEWQLRYHHSLDY